MKILKLVILIVMFAGVTVFGGAIERLDTLRAVSLEKVGLTGATNQMPTVNANLAVNISIQWVSANFPAVEKTGGDTCSAGVTSYAISDASFDRLIWCRIWRIHPPKEKDSLAVLRVIPADSVYEYVQEGKTLPAISDPLAYAYAWAGSLYVSPAPEYEDILMYGYCAIGEFLLADDSTTDIHPRYRELIVDHAASIIREELGLGKVGE